MERADGNLHLEEGPLERASAFQQGMPFTTSRQMRLAAVRPIACLVQLDLHLDRYCSVRKTAFRF